MPPKFYASKKTAIAKKKVGVPRSLTDTMTQWDEIFSDVGEKASNISTKVQNTHNEYFHIQKQSVNKKLPGNE